MKYLFLILLLVSCAHHPSEKVPSKYNRKDWAHWSDFDKNCLNTRNEILKTRSLSPVTFDRKGCRVIKGKWKDYYYPEVHVIAKIVDIDHLVPLKHAHDTGGEKWTALRKEAFANDPDNLVITNKSYNRKKGSKGIDSWLPVHKEYACKYIKDWLRIKKKYDLKLTVKEMNTVTTSACPGL